MILYGYNFNEAEKILKKVLPEDIYEEIDGLKLESAASTIMFSNGTSAIYFKPGIPIDHLGGVIVHECFHATNNILNTLDLFLTDTSEEAYAYLIQYLYDEIAKRLKLCAR
jgi:hypothetical protein